MKKLVVIFFSFFVLSGINVTNSQSNTFPATGNVGIGTTAPSTIFEVVDNKDASNYIKVRNESSGVNARVGYLLYNGSGVGDYFAFVLNGKNYNGVPGWADRVITGSGSSVTNGLVLYATTGGIQMSASGANNPDIYVSSNGNVGFNTRNPSSKLSVNGNVESKEIQVKATIADYVFADDYKIMPLEEVESFINENKHLPNVFSEKDQIANNGNIPLGQVTMSLLEKIEELTLYIIDLNKRIKELENK
jgi:hypothetical protein